MSLNYDQPDIWLQRAELLRAALTPARPVNDRTLFAGRAEQLIRITDTFASPGEHGAIFGERGVGKTSLATIAEQIALLSGRLAVRVNCRATDDMSAVWRRVGEALDRRFRVDQARDKQFAHLDGLVQGAIELLTGQSASSNEALIAFEMLNDQTPFVVFLDEFDRIDDPNVEASLVDVMKTISDQGLATTINIVGVADNVNSLIEEHESIGRGLNEIEMPRMSVEELQEILKRALAHAEMTAELEAAQVICQISAGLPHYVHLMGLQAGLSAVGFESTVVTVDHVLNTLDLCVKRAQEHVSRLYHAATHSTRPNNFKQVLLAAALTPTDEQGYFAPGDLRAPMSAILGQTAKISQVSDQLIQFAADERGPVLHKTGVTNRPRYRIDEPLLIPYVAMRGVAESLITPDLLRKLLSER